jgi:hypothetical protein
MKRITKIHIFPFLFSLYPILALWNRNVIYVNLEVALRPIIISLVVTGILWGVLRLALKDTIRSGILTTLIIMIFFFYGHTYLFLLDQMGPEVARHRYTLAFFGTAFIVGAWWVIMKLQKTQAVSQFLTASGVILVGISLLQLGWYQFGVFQASTRNVELQIEGDEEHEPESLPNIYLIILDGYTRSDVLRQEYDYDNSSFLQALTEMGFYVADCSQSNYPSTIYSLTSLMNSDYLLNFLDRKAIRKKLIPPLKNSLVKRVLDSAGYVTVAFENRAQGHFDLFEDIHLSHNPVILEKMDLLSGINEFESMVIDTSFLRIMVDMPQLIPKSLAGNIRSGEFYEHYLQTQYMLEELPNLAQLDEPLFVFAHFMIPHDPFVFLPDGSFEFTGDQGSIIGYRNNVAFIDNHLPTTLERIIETSEVPPVIILMGDHGPTGKNVTPEMRMAILNAVYTDEAVKTSFYDEITPVNTFRILLNHYFGKNLELLEDISFHAYGVGKMNESNIIPNTCSK